MRNNQQTILLKIAKTFNDHNIKWALGGSLMLYYYKLVDHANDIDILIAEKDITEALKALNMIARPLAVVQKKEYLTTCFKSFTINDVDIDVMADFKIKHSAGVYQFPFKTINITKRISLDDIEIPLSSLEDWYIAYLLMSGRAEKVKLIEDHFKNNGIRLPQLLEDALKQALPTDVQTKIIRLLS